MTKKMTRKEALSTLIEIAEEWKTQNFATDEFGGWHTEEAIAVAQKMIESINKQANRPKTKSSTRLQNENYAKKFIALLQEKPAGFLASAKWMSENIPYVMTSQKAVAVAKIAEEWGAVSRVVEKKRTYYVLNDYYEG